MDGICSYRLRAERHQWDSSDRRLEERYGTSYRTSTPVSGTPRSNGILTLGGIPVAYRTPTSATWSVAAVHAPGSTPHGPRRVLLPAAPVLVV